MQAEAPILTVDGGGTGTRVRLLSADGATMGEGTAGPSSLTYGIEQSWHQVCAAAQAAADKAGTDLSGVRLWGGFAGAGVPSVEDAFRAADPLGCAEIVVMSDGRAALAGAFGGGPGAVLAIGTGVIALAGDPAGHVRWASGWGWPAGDEGGGSWIGRRAVGALQAHIDGRRALDAALASRLGAAVGGDYVAMQAWLDRATATDYAALAPVVLAAAADGSARADAILRDAAAACERALLAVSPEGPAALLGGLAGPLSPWVPNATRARLRPPEGTALDGLRLLALSGQRPERDFQTWPSA